MNTATATLARRLAATLTGLLLTAATALAQTTSPPAWLAARAMGLGSIRPAGPAAAAVDAAGNLYAVGTFSGAVTVGRFALVSQGDTDGYLAKYAPDGTALWVQQLGSAGADKAAAIALDAAGNAYVTGRFVGAINLGNGLALDSRGTTQAKTFCIRYSPAGVPQWAQQSNDYNYSLGSGIGVDANGHVFLAGTMFGYLVLGSTPLEVPDGPSTSFYSYAAFLARLNAATGKVESLTAAYSYRREPNVPPLVAVAPSGTRVYLLAHFEGQLLLPGGAKLAGSGDLDAGVLSYTANGQLEWAQLVGSPQRDELTQAVANAAGQLYVVGHSLGSVRAGLFTLPNNGGSDGYLLKYDQSGEVQWAQLVNSPGNDQLLGLALDATGAPYVTGSFERTVSIGTQKLTSTGLSDVLVAAYSPEGTPRWAQQAGSSTGPDYGAALGLAANGTVQVLGSYSSPAIFGSTVLGQPATGGNFVARLGSTVLGTSAAARPLALSLVPNPATGRVRLPGLPAGRPVEVLDALGRLVRTAALAPDASFSVQGLTPGLYLVRATDAQNQTYAGRLMVE